MNLLIKKKYLEFCTVNISLKFNRVVIVLLHLQLKMVYEIFEKYDKFTIMIDHQFPETISGIRNGSELQLLRYCYYIPDNQIFNSIISIVSTVYITLAASVKQRCRLLR